MRQLLEDWVIVGALAAAVGGTASYAIKADRANAALLGSATGAVIGAAISTKRQEAEQKTLLDAKAAEQKTLLYEKAAEQKTLLDEKEKLKEEKQGIENELQRLKERAAERNEWERLTAELPMLRAEVAALQTHQRNLSAVEGRFVQTQEELQQVKQKLTTLNQQRQNLESRVADINQENPNLSSREQLQNEIEQSRLERSGLQGQITALQSEKERLESQRQSLINVSAQLATNQAELERVNERIAEAGSREQELVQQTAQQIENSRSQVERLEEQRRSLLGVEAELTNRQAELNAVTARIAEARRQEELLKQQAAQLDFIRVTYDSLVSQQQSLEERVNNELRPEIDRLEAEKQRILQAIKENQQRYQRYEELRERLESLNIQIREREVDVRQLERKIHELQDIQARLEENNAELREEIEGIEGSTDVALQALIEPLWQSPPNDKRTIGNTTRDEQEFLENFISYIQDQGLTFPKRVIRAFHTSLKVQDISVLVVLAGISGTGKSQLPQQYANYIKAQLLTLAVQPRWDSPQDLQGFYNYVEKKFKPTDLMRGLYQYNHDEAMSDRIVIVLLDEMNLARVEYYFSEFLSKLETRRSHPTYLEIDVGSLPIRDDERRLRIPNQFLFVGTMNEDETTQSLSDKVLDRANVLTFGKPQQLQLRQRSDAQNGSANPSGYLAYSDFQRWTRLPDPNSSVVARIKQHLDAVNRVMESMGHPFAHRVYQAIVQYVVNYPGVEDENSEAFKFAIADQFGQKLLPKLRGVMVEEAHEDLEELGGIIAKIDDAPLIDAFSQARKGRYGQFQWQGLIYNEASPV